MSEVLQANVFFFITSVAVVAFTILVCVVLYQVIKILGTVRQIVDRVEAGSELVTENIQNIQNYFKDGALFKTIFGGVMSLLGSEKKSTPRRSRSKKVHVDDDKDIT